MEFQTINQENVYLEFIDSGYVSGQKINDVNSYSSKISSQFSMSFRELLKFGMNGSINDKIAGIGSDTSYNVSSETEFKASIAKQTEEEMKSVITTDYTVPPNGKLGTVLYKVDFQFGGKKITVVTNSITNFWTKKNLSPFKQRKLSSSLFDIANSLDKDEFPLSKREELTKITQPILALPIKGRTCHHVKFLKEHNDSCDVDGKYCINLDGNTFVVCHHRDFEWIGGEGCNCQGVDNKNVLIERAENLSPAYKSLKS